MCEIDNVIINIVSFVITFSLVYIVTLQPFYESDFKNIDTLCLNLDLFLMSKAIFQNINNQSFINQF